MGLYNWYCRFLKKCLFLNVTFLSKACFNIGIQTSIIEFKSGINIYLLIILDNNDLTKESVIKLVICKKNEYVYEDYQNLF